MSGSDRPSWLKFHESIAFERQRVGRVADVPQFVDEAAARRVGERRLITVDDGSPPAASALPTGATIRPS